MEFLNSAEVFNLTQLSDSEFISMLEFGELETKVGKEGELLINLEKLNPETLAKRSNKRRSHISENDLALLEEKVASEIINSLDNIIDEAIEVAKLWSSKNN